MLTAIKHPRPNPVITRFRTLGDISASEEHKLLMAADLSRTVKASYEIIRRSDFADRPLLVLEGWCALTQIFRDGRRQIIDVVLPGEIIEADRPDAIGITALTSATYCPLPLFEQVDQGLGRVREISRTLVMGQLMRQVARLGRLNAQQRIADWLLEIHERLTLAGVATGNSMPMPLTQEMISDLLGLTNVHVNRMLTAMRASRLIDRYAGRLTLLDVHRLETIIGCTGKR